MEQQATTNHGTPPMVINVRAVSLTMAGLCTLVCSIRLYMRAFVVNSFNLDDFMVVVALFMVNGFSALAFTITYYGLGRHQNTVSMEDLLKFLEIYYVALSTYLLVAAAVKASLTIFIMRIFPQRYIQYIGRGLLAFILAFSISGELALVFQCKPVRAFFDKTIQGATCWPSDTLFAVTMYQGVVMFVMDLVILLLPMRAIWQLQMPVRKRLWLAVMFSFGIVASAAALVRFSTLVFTKDSTDATYSAATSLIWMEVEFNLGLLAGSLSSIRKLFKIKSIFSSQEHYTKQASTEQYELSNGYKRNKINDQKHMWKGNGIMKTSEVITHVQRTRSESQERIVPIYGQSEPTSTTISSKGDRKIRQGGF